MHQHKESGIAIWYILIGIILFAALSFSFMRSVSQSQSGVNREQAKVMANEILQYAKGIEQGVQRLMMVNGCSENEISFYSLKWANPLDYDNPNSAVSGGDFHCFVFDPQGAGLNWKGPKGNDGSPYIFTSSLFVGDIGTTKPELLIILPNVDINVCLELNNLLKVTNVSGSPPRDGGAANYMGRYFVGTYTATSLLRSANLINYYGGCFEGGHATTPPIGTYHFYLILITR